MAAGSRHRRGPAVTGSNPVLPFLLLFGATYFFAEFGPNTTTFVYPAEIFPVRVRTTSHGIAAAAGKLGAFAGTYALTALLPIIGFPRTSAIVAGVCVLGLLVTVTLLPEPKGLSLEELTEPGSGWPAPVESEKAEPGGPVGEAANQRRL